VLLIAACLDKPACRRLAQRAHELGLETLLETHTPGDTEYIDDNIDMVGVNNRNLGTFSVDVNNSMLMLPYLPADRVLVSESGLSTPETVMQLRSSGYRGFLIGETFMKTGNPGKALREFKQKLKGS
jgi:indole-3-glycerol phosphate synthase